MLRPNHRTGQAKARAANSRRRAAYVHQAPLNPLSMPAWNLPGRPFDQSRPPERLPVQSAICPFVDGIQFISYGYFQPCLTFSSSGRLPDDNRLRSVSAAQDRNAEGVQPLAITRDIDSRSRKTGNITH